LFESLDKNGGNVFENKEKGPCGKNRVMFSSKYKINYGTQNLYWTRVLKGLYKFFKFNMYCYNILNIKNISIICINFSLSKK